MIKAMAALHHQGTKLNNQRLQAFKSGCFKKLIDHSRLMKRLLPQGG